MVLVIPVLAEEVQALEEAVLIVVQEAVLGPQDLPEITANLANQELQETQDKLDVHLFKYVNKQLRHHAIHVQLDHQDRQVNQAHQAMPVQMEIQGKEAEIPNPDPQDQRDHLDHQDQMDSQEPQEIQVKMHNPKKQAQDNQDPPETQDHQDHQDQQASQDSRAAQADQDLKDLMDNQELQEMTVNQDKLGNLANQEAAERKVSVRNTAPLTVESSSKTVHVDVKSQFSKRSRGDLLNPLCPMNQHTFILLLVAQKTAIYYVSLLYCTQGLASIFGFSNPLFL